LSFSTTSTIVASISTWRFEEPITSSRNFCSFSCCREVARTETIPASGFTMTEAASRKVRRCSTKSVFWACCVSPGVSTCVRFCVDVVRPLRGCVVVRAWVEDTALCPRFWTKVSLLPSGRSLSVSRSMSRMFFSSVSQKRCRELVVSVRVELFAPEEPPPVVPPTPPDITCVAMPNVSTTSRDMFT
jgi:hypothetical protein